MWFFVKISKKTSQIYAQTFYAVGKIVPILVYIPDCEKELNNKSHQVSQKNNIKIIGSVVKTRNTQQKAKKVIKRRRELQHKKYFK